MKIAIVAHGWPPAWGGGEQMMYRLGLELGKRGVEFEVFTPTQHNSEYDNGKIKVNRIPMDETGTTTPTHNSAVEDIMKGVYDPTIPEKWLEKVCASTAFEDTTHILSSPHNILGVAPSFFARMKERGIKSAIIQFDISPNLTSLLLSAYAESRSWDEAFKQAQEEDELLFAEYGTDSDEIKEYLYRRFSMSHYNANALIHISECNNQVNKVAQEMMGCPTFLLYPPLDFSLYQENYTGKQLEQVNVLMMNPDIHKGRSVMWQVMKALPSNTTFRVLIGGYGEGDTFKALLQNCIPEVVDRVDFVDYVKDIRQFFTSGEVFIFPSWREGYGYAGIEAVLSGCKTLTTDFPAIKEAVGQSAVCLPMNSQISKWVQSIEDMRKGVLKPRQSREERLAYMIERQDKQIKGLIAYLQTL